ncbi:organic cation transporter protein-like [Leguminivora glycinivorella]|uniref:organic cation transporter protein-like n=1 Tax=Leguminivora glycinivorella TaxID=1035111 RepID=UPI00200D95A4|nr:organic cation transporter protein-like [Leguminivora glycinivorella]
MTGTNDRKDVDSGSSTEVFSELSTFGRFQTLQYFFICVPLMMVAMMNVNYMFVAESVNYRCRVPDCDELHTNFTKPLWWPESNDVKCVRPIFNLSQINATCLNQVPVEFEKCDEWIYEHSNSVVSELDIGCASWKPPLIGSAHNIGMIFSMIIMGWMADRFGRKPILILCAVGGSVGSLKLLVSNFYAYVGLEFLESFISSGLYTVAIVLMIEVGGETKRVLTGVIFSYATYVGEVLFGFLAMGFQQWKALLLATYAPVILFIVYIILLHESTRWQLLQGKAFEARKTFKTIAKLNKLSISNEDIDNISENDLRTKFNVASQKEKESFKEIINSKEIMTRVIVVSFCFFTCGLVYYGVAMQSIYLPGDKYVNFLLTSLASLPGDLIAFFTFPKYGRRISLQCGFIFCAIFLLAQAFTPDAMVWLKLSLFLCGKIGTALCFTGLFTYSLELFPTSVRGSLTGFGNTFSRVGSTLSPFTMLLIDILPALPSILFAALAITSALVVQFTPETKSIPMFDTIQQVEAYKSKMSTRL